MNVVRGAIILCDHLDQMHNGKWLIVGTYTRRVTNQEVVHFPTGAKLYVRFQVERTGLHVVEVLFIDRSQPSNAEPIMRVRVNVEVHSIDSPAELSIVTQPFTISRPLNQSATATVTSTFTWWATVGDNELATCPMVIQFNPVSAVGDGSSASPMH